MASDKPNRIGPFGALLLVLGTAAALDMISYERRLNKRYGWDCFVLGCAVGLLMGIIVGGFLL